MPITKELKNVKKLKSVDFTSKQAEALVDVIEQSHIDGQQILKDFIRNEISGLELHTKMLLSEMEVKLKTSLNNLPMKYSVIVAGFIGIALAIPKLLW